MLKIIRMLLENIIENIDAGNSNLTDKECLEIIDIIKTFGDKEKPLSKYQAYTYLNVSRATFDNMVKQGKLPKGHKRQGFKELYWTEKELNNFKSL